MNKSNQKLKKIISQHIKTPSIINNLNFHKHGNYSVFSKDFQFNFLMKVKQ